MRILISRTDAIGDVILTLPMAGVLKKEMPDVEIVFLGRNYTKAIIQQSSFVDEFISWDDIVPLSVKEQVKMLRSLNLDAVIHVFPRPAIAKLAKKAGIKYRIGTSRRVYHWYTCNQKISLSRRKSDLHEAQLNLKLLEAFSIKTDFELSELPQFYGFSTPKKSLDNIDKLLSKDKFNLILHAKSHGSAREWGIPNFLKLIEILPEKKFRIFISGTDKEKEALKPLREHPKTVDVCSLFSLDEFISFIASCDGLVAASTGPLHIAAAFGKKAIGIYPGVRPMHPGRWAPVGLNADYLSSKEDCEACQKGLDCQCIQDIKPELVVEKLNANMFK